MSKRTSEKQKEYSAKKAKNLTDAYIANLLRLPVNILRGHESEIIELKRAHIKLRRAIKACHKGD